MKKVLTVLFVWIPAALVAASVLWVLILKWAPVKVTPLMIKRSVQTGTLSYKYRWVPLEEISPCMVAGVIAAEDEKFYSHSGFDYEQIALVRKDYEQGCGKLRGCSTISQQTAKNCFTFCSRTWARKAIETYFTVLIEAIWGKQRILEVYLNVAETGPGIYGVEAAADNYYSIHAKELTIADASALACCLPNPRFRNPEWVYCNMEKRRGEIARRAASIQLPQR